jgi:hypothetical protein
MPVVVNLPAFPNDETPAPPQATMEIPIPMDTHTMDTKMDNLIKASKAWTLQLSNANEPRYEGYQTAMVYAMQADHPPSHTPMNFPPPNAPTGPAYYPPGLKYQQNLWQALGHCINCDELGHIRTFCPDVRTNQEYGIVHLSDCGRLSLGPREANGGEISRYRPERRLLSMWDYARECHGTRELEVFGNIRRKDVEAVEGIVLRKGGDVGRHRGSGEMVAL